MILTGRTRHGEPAQRGAPNLSQFDYEAFFASSQRTLVQSLHNELRVGPRFADSASVARSKGDMDDYVYGKRNAIQAAEFIQRFVSRVSDVTVRNEIKVNLAELHRLISRLG
jgi:hypothetical protein